MKRTLPVLLDTLYALALALWFGLAAGLLVIASSAVPNAVIDQFARRASALIEAAGIAMVGVQFLLRRRYQLDRQAFVADGIRQILTFGALLLAEFGRYGPLKADRAITAHDVSTLCLLTSAQMVVLAVVTALTSWLFLPRIVSGPTMAPASPPSATPAATSTAPRRAAIPPKPLKSTTPSKRK